MQPTFPESRHHFAFHQKPYCLGDLRALCQVTLTTKSSATSGCIMFAIASHVSVGMSCRLLGTREVLMLSSIARMPCAHTPFRSRHCRSVHQFRSVVGLNDCS